MKNKSQFVIIIIIIIGLMLLFTRLSYNKGYEIGRKTGFYRCLKGISENHEMVPTKKDVENFLKDNPDIVKGVDF